MQLFKKRYPKFRIVKFGNKFHAETKTWFGGYYKCIIRQYTYGACLYELRTPNYNL